MATIYTLVQPLIPGSAYILPIKVGDQSDTDIFKRTVTLATGDCKISKDGATFANTTNLPVETGTSGLLMLTITAAETTGVTNWLIVDMHDAAGDEWQDVTYYIPASQAVTVADFTTAMTEAYASLGGTLTLAQFVYGMMQWHEERSVGAFDSDGEATLTTKKRDQSTTAATYTVDADSITRAT